MKEEEQLLTPSEAAQLLRVPLSWIYDRTRREAIPLQRLGKYRRIPKTHLLRWVALGCPTNWREIPLESEGLPNE